LSPFYQATQSIFIQALPEKVYEALTNWALRAQWRAGIQVEWQGGPQAFAGQEVTFRIKDGLLRIQIRFKVTGLEAPHRIFMEYVGKPLEGRHAIELKPENGGCLVAFYWMKVRPVGIPAKLYFALGFGMRDHARRTKETLEMLKAFLEK